MNMDLNDFFIILMGIIMVVVIMIFILWFMKEMGFFTDNKKRKQEFKNSQEENMMGEASLHQSEEYNKFELKTDLKKNTEKILINIPEICPVCNQYNIEGYFNYKLKNKVYVKIPLCEEHNKKLGQKPSLFNSNIDIVLILCFVLSLIIGILVYLITQGSYFFSLILFVSIISIFIYILKKIFEKAHYNLYIGKINDYVRLGYSKDTIVIIIKNFNWAKEFRSLNNWKEIPYSSKKIKTHREKGFKWMKILLLWIAMSIPIIIISIIYFPIYAKLILYFSVIVPIFLIIIVFSFHYLEEQALKTQPLSQSGKLALIIIAIIIFIILTLGYFDVIQIF